MTPLHRVWNQESLTLLISNHKLKQLRMRIILLTRKSAFQIYCANYLWRKGLLTTVIFEEGSSIPTNISSFSYRRLYKKFIEMLTYTLNNPLVFFEYLRFIINKNKYFGSQELYNKKLLRKDYEVLVDGLYAVTVPIINSQQVKSVLQDLAPDIVFVFGTRLINSQLFESCSAKFINMHWGWSPDYRGEGIVSALAVQGEEALGVTIHLISSKIDGGNILYRSRPKVDSSDNFYSIGLRLTVLGCELMVKVVEKYKDCGLLVGESQDLSQGHLYDSKYMRSHIEFYHKAWERLKKNVVVN